MLAPLGPFALTGIGQTIAIIPSGQYAGPNQLGDVLLCNNSGYTIALASSQDGPLPNLNPGQVTTYPAPTQGGSLTGTVISGSPGTAGPTLTGQAALQGESFDGAYPSSVPLSPGPYQALLAGPQDTTVVVNTFSYATEGLLIFSAEVLESATQVVQTGLISFLAVNLPVITLAAPSGSNWGSYYVPCVGVPQYWLNNPLDPLSARSVNAAVTLTFGGSGDVVVWEVDDAQGLPLNS